MGASQSRSEPDEKVFHSETPISFSQDVVNNLSDHLESQETSPERQSILDAHIRARIQGELEHLRREEEIIREEIERALEKENLDRESNMAGDASDRDGGEVGDIKSSAALSGDLEEIRGKIDKYQSRRALDEHPDIKRNGETVVDCYKNNKSTPLNCWHEVSKFKASVTQLEQQYFKSL
ncbi:hypothetical protein BDQ12DRAFT_676882 [Crucibulum laeve]|uniref:DUF1690-domain-containing protein n=1 Tax=Crucibulum laeve TaxID=68775 RepID=A0A5C3MDL3_9AGAR|nr:hypothetical protein BDQ12DRAFT_676882 [Crucibulum laeve]